MKPFQSPESHPHKTMFNVDVVLLPAGASNAAHTLQFSKMPSLTTRSADDAIFKSFRLLTVL
jgi:hypothetical protein